MLPISRLKIPLPFTKSKLIETKNYTLIILSVYFINLLSITYL